MQKSLDFEQSLLSSILIIFIALQTAKSLFVLGFMNPMDKYKNILYVKKYFIEVQRYIYP